MCCRKWPTIAELMHDRPAKRQKTDGTESRTETTRVQDPKDVMADVIAAKARAAIAKVKTDLGGLKGLRLSSTFRSLGGVVPSGFDRLGNPLDSQGNAIGAAKLFANSSMKVNQNILKRQAASRSRAAARHGRVLETTQNQWFDSKLKTGNRRRESAFRFVQEGYYAAQEEKMQSGCAAEGEEADGAEVSPAIDKHAPVPLKLRTEELIPEVEPWDAVLIKVLSREMNDGLGFQWEISRDKLTHYIEHPLPIAPHGVKNAPQAVYLTTKERRKLRRRKRMEKEKEKQDKIRLGLIAPPPPKVKLANLRRVMGREAAADPSKVEKEVRKQMAARLEQHELRNQARMLTPEQRRAKTIEHWKQTAETKVLVESSIYRLYDDFDSKKILFKLDRNAQQLHLTGVCVVLKGVRCMVVVEGGPRSIRRYRRLMLRRIKWNPDDEKDNEEPNGDAEDDEVYGGTCVTSVGGDEALFEKRRLAKDPWMPRVVWEGTIEERRFHRWQVHVVSTEVEAQKILTQKKAGDLWDKVGRFRDVTEDIQDG